MYVYIHYWERLSCLYTYISRGAHLYRFWPRFGHNCVLNTEDARQPRHRPLDTQTRCTHITAPQSQWWFIQPFPSHRSPTDGPTHPGQSHRHRQGRFYMVKWPAPHSEQGAHKIKTRLVQCSEACEPRGGSPSPYPCFFAHKVFFPTVPYQGRP